MRTVEAWLLTRTQWTDCRVKLESLWEAMQQVDVSTGLPRGFLHLRLAPSGTGRLLTLSTQRTLWQNHLRFFQSGGLRTALAQGATLTAGEAAAARVEEAGEGERATDEEERVRRELDAVVAARPGPSVRAARSSPRVANALPDYPTCLFRFSAKRRSEVIRPHPSQGVLGPPACVELRFC